MKHFLVWGIACICFASLFASAQEPGSVVEARANPPVMDDDLRELVEKVMLLELRKAVDLTDDQIVMLVRRLGTFKDRLTRMKFELGTQREELRVCLAQGLGETEIQSKLEALLGQEEAIADLLQAMIDEAAKDFSVSKTAQLYLFVGDFEALMRQKILRARYTHQHGNAPSTSEQLLIDELSRRQALGPTGLADEDMVSLFDGLLMTQLARALDLEPEETVLLFGRVGTYKDQLHELKWQIGASREALRAVVEQNASAETIERHLTDQLLQERAAAALTRTMVTEAQKDVSLAQSARLYLFVGDFEQYVARLFERVQSATP